MYNDSDPRASLAGAADTRDSGAPIAPPEFFDLRASAPETGGTPEERTFVVRGQNVVLVHTFAHGGDELDNGAPGGEVAVLTTDDAASYEVVRADGTATTVDAPGLTVVPPGASRLRVLTDGPIVRLFESTEGEWAERAVNADSYTRPHPRVAALTRWPEPTGEERVRVYPLSAVAEQPGRFGRIFRTRAFMVNFLPALDGPRDPRKLSPHDHADFEQLSLATEGEFVHHIRTPWLPDRTTWREDDHVHLGSPSLAVIPPPTVHTSEAHAGGRHLLVDIFSPPRTDFSQKPGWVLNADDYPMP
ncbi:hypothetical protein [Streptomyces halstedii]|uniref:Uncharacterized protein n=1 Tax=Streptomyces halstedii TaxID=1944 RepID=A0A6N9U448_STRHA|nr:hypothetical protein [Streptomyces halstedii]NEA16793.1 hypothetical protein [Streptomyces halstedii]